jgi:hypothetical protein
MEKEELLLHLSGNTHLRCLGILILLLFFFLKIFFLNNSTFLLWPMPLFYLDKCKCRRHPFMFFEIAYCLLI